MSDEPKKVPLPLKRRKPNDIINKEQDEEIIIDQLQNSDGDGYADGAPCQKRMSITTSKILGTAHPHKPRIGPRYQADLPPLQHRPAQKQK